VWRLMYKFTSQSPLALSSGKHLKTYEIAYETYGKLNADHSNAILICHALSGDAHASNPESETENPGWWQLMVGPEKPIDTNRFFVICTNVLGSCYGSTGPTSLDPDTHKQYQLSFPVITIEDMVNAQAALIDHLDIQTLFAVVGGSMGGMQTLQWSISHPNRLKKAIVIAAAAQLGPQSLAFNTIGREAIQATPETPNIGLAIARMIGHITYRSDESIGTKFGRKLQEADYGYGFSTEFEIESYLKYQGEKFINRFDATTYLYLSKAMSYFDLIKSYGSLESAFKNCTAQFLIMSISSDWLYPSEQSKEMAKTLIKLNKTVTYCEINSPHGHDSFLMESNDLSTMIRSFLDSTS